MASIFDIPQEELIEKVAEELKQFEELKPPLSIAYVKTGANKERPPTRKDWWYIRSASVLRRIYKLGPIGVSKLRTKYGDKKRRGHKTEEFRKASGSVIRKILQGLEKAGLAKQIEKGVHKGRIITEKGKSLLDKAATSVQKGKPLKFEKVEIKKKEEVKKEKIEKKEEKIKEKKEVKEKPKVEKKERIKKREIEKKPREKIPAAEELVKKTKEFMKGKMPSAAELIEEAKKPSAEELVEEAKKKTKKEKKQEKVPSAHELAAKKEKKINRLRWI